MTKNFRAIKASFIMGIMLVSVFVAFSGMSPESNTASGKMVTFPAFLTFKFPEGAFDKLNEPIGVEEVVSINFEVGYKIGPSQYLKNPIGKFFLFNSFIIFPQQVHLEVVNPPEWAEIYVSPSDVNIDIREDGEYEYHPVSLIISPLMDAPAEPDTFILKASTSARGRIDEISYEYTISYMPGYNPLIYVHVDRPTRTAGPGETLNFKATIENQGNKQTIVTIRIKDAPSDWAPLLSTSSVPIGPGETKEVTFSAVTPYSFGWHNELRSFTLEFTPEKVPRQTPAITGTPEEVQVRVKSMGFWPPGLEIAVLVILFIIVAFLVRRIMKKRKAS